MANVVFILGAGLSANAGFPTAAKLIDEMIALQKDSDFDGMIESNLVFNAGQPFKEKRKHFFESLPVVKQMGNPVDFLLRTNGDLQDIGAFCIAYVLLRQEAAHKMHPEPHCYTYLFKAIGIGKETQRRPHECRFITLNYERSLEYAFSRYCRVFGVNYFANRGFLRVHHLHGSFGDLDSDKAYGFQGSIRTEAHLQSIDRSSRLIRTTYSDSHDQEQSYRKAFAMIEQSDIVVVIGTSLDTDIFARLHQSLHDGQRVFIHCWEHDQNMISEFTRRARASQCPNQRSI